MYNIKRLSFALKLYLNCITKCYIFVINTTNFINYVLNIVKGLFFIFFIIKLKTYIFVFSTINFLDFLFATAKVVPKFHNKLLYQLFSSFHVKYSKQPD